MNQININNYIFIKKIKIIHKNSKEYSKIN